MSASSNSRERRRKLRLGESSAEETGMTVPGQGEPEASGDGDEGRPKDPLSQAPAKPERAGPEEPRALSDDAAPAARAVPAKEERDQS